MNLNYIDIVVNQLRQFCPIFGGRVSGAGDYADDFRKDENAQMDLPAAYVLPWAFDCEPNESGNDTWKKATDTYRIVVAIGNTDRRGQAAITTADQMKWYILKALQNFNPDPTRVIPPGMDWVGAQVFDMDAKRLWVQFDFEFSYSIGPEDAWQPTGIPVNGLDFSIPVGSGPEDQINVTLNNS